MGDTYRVISSSSESEIKIKGSRFIARVFPVTTRDDVERCLSDVRRIDRDASHHCTAYRVGTGDGETRFNDDGEPSGTAGRPIMRQIDAFELTNTLVVVTRYFGGTKLGTGGLIRAYGQAAKEVLSNARVRVVIERSEVTVEFQYADTSQAMHTIDKYDIKMIETSYSDHTTIRLAIRRSDLDGFVRAFEDAVSGRGTVTLHETS